MSFYKNQQKSVHFRSRTLFCFFKKNSVESNAKKHIIFSEKIGEKSDKKMVKKKLVQKSGQNSFKKKKNARLKKPSAILTKKLKALVLLEFRKQKPSLYIYNLLINIIRIWYKL